jgi:hypothetical protein
VFDLHLHGVVDLVVELTPPEGRAVWVLIWVLFRALSEDSSGSGGELSPLLPQQAQSESPSSTSFNVYQHTQIQMGHAS